MKEISRNNIFVPHDIPSPQSGTFRDNFMQASSGTGIFLLIQESFTHNEPFLTSSKKIYESVKSGKSGVIVTSLGRIRTVESQYKEIPFIVDLTPNYWLNNNLYSFKPTTDWLQSLNIYKDNGIDINGVLLSLSGADLESGDKLTEVLDLVTTLHKSGILFFLKYDGGKIPFPVLIKIVSLLGIDSLIIDKAVEINLESDNLSQLPFQLILSDTSLSQSKELFTNLELYLAKGIKGVMLSESLTLRNVDDCKKLINATNLMLYEGKDSDDAYDFIIS